MRRTFIAAAILLCATVCFARTNDSQSLTRYSSSYSLGENNFIWIVVDGGSLIFGESVHGRGGRLVSVSLRSATHWTKIQVPVLLVNGGLDRNVPGKVSATRIEQFLKTAGNKNVTIRFFPEADHQFWKVSKLGQRDGRSNQVGVYREMIAWLLANTKRN